MPRSSVRAGRDAPALAPIHNEVDASRQASQIIHFHGGPNLLRQNFRIQLPRLQAAADGEVSLLLDFHRYW